VLSEYHLGLVPDARGRGLGQGLLHAFLRGGRAAGATTFVGSCAEGNRAARVVLERAGCTPLGRRLVFELAP
jgi:RimJ/RimL family protein N-acetyltransferase